MAHHPVRCRLEAVGGEGGQEAIARRHPRQVEGQGFGEEQHVLEFRYRLVRRVAHEDMPVPRHDTGDLGHAVAGTQTRGRDSLSL